MTEPRLLCVVNSPSPNTTELYRWLAEQGTLQIEVIYTRGDNAKWKDPVAVTGYASTRLGGRTWLGRVFRLQRILARGSHDLVLLQGYGDPVHLAALAMLSRSTRPWIFWGERIRSGPGFLRNRIKAWAVGQINRARAVYAAVQGSAADDPRIRHPDRYRSALFGTFERFVNEWLPGRDLLREDLVFQPQSRFILGADGAMLVSHVGRLEDMAALEDYLQDTLGRRPEVGHLNRTRPVGHYREHYSPGMRDTVAEIYRGDIELFRHDFWETA